jgi:hypothetical protein
MHAAKRKGRLTLTIEARERRLFRRVLQAIIRNYKKPPEALPAPAARVWYSTAGCQSARMSAEQTGEWIGELRAIRKSRLRLLERCVRQMKSASKGSSELKLSIVHAATLMTSLNDHRLFLAARHNLGEAELDWPTLASVAALKPARRKALFEISVLALVIEILLSVIDPEAVNWLE